MPLPPGAYNVINNTIWDDDLTSWVPASSTPDVSTATIPVEYKVLFDRYAPGVVPKIESDQKPGESWTDTWSRISSALLMSIQQYKLIDYNTERAKKGLPPVDIAAYSGVGVNIGLSPSTQQLLLFGGLAVAALLFLNRSSK